MGNFWIKTSIQCKISKFIITFFTISFLLTVIPPESFFLLGIQEASAQVSKVADKQNLEKELTLPITTDTSTRGLIYNYHSNGNSSISDPTKSTKFLPLLATAFRILVQKVGPTIAKKAWDLAQPYFRMAITQASKFTMDGPGSGGRIVQVRYRKGGSVLFRLDFYPVRSGGPFTLHYHVGPNTNNHNVIWTSTIY